MNYVPFDNRPTAADERLGRQLGAKRRFRGLVGVVAFAAIALVVYFGARELIGSGDRAPSVATEPGIPSGALEATVLWVHDGDTLHIRTDADDDVTVRLNAIDTPEIGDNLECFGNDARDLARKLMPEGSTVWVTADERPTDRFGRSLLYVFTSEGRFVNEVLVARGAAETLFIEDDERYREQLEAAEAAARSGNAGAWGAC